MSLPRSIRDAIASSGATKYVSFLDVQKDRGVGQKISTHSQWEGLNDPMVGSDLNVSFPLNKIALSAGSNSPILPSFGADVLAGSTTYSIKRVDNYRKQKTLLGRILWKLKGTTFSVSRQDAPIKIGFTALSTQLVNDIIIRVRYLGEVPMAFTVVFKTKDGDQVGSSSVEITPTNSITDHQITGLNASLDRGSFYFLEISYTPYDTSLIPGNFRGGSWSITTFHPTTIEVFSYTSSGVWSIPTTAGGFNTGGKSGYQSSGSAIRQISFKSIPLDEGNIFMSDIKPLGTGVVYTLYSTDSDVVSQETTLTNWVNEGVVVSGDAVSTHKYFRVKIDLTSNVANDATPQIDYVDIIFRPAPLTIGTHPEVGNPTVVALDKLTQFSSSLSPNIKNSIVGKIRVTLNPEDEIAGLINNPLNGADVTVRLGVDGVSETVEWYKGIVDDLTFNSKQYILSIKDRNNIADIKVPNPLPAWDSTQTYGISNSDRVTYNSIGYQSIQSNNINHVPTDNLWWNPLATAWNTLSYNIASNAEFPGQRWHASDVIKDLLTNQLNLPDNVIDFSSLNELKTRFPTRTVERVIQESTSTKEMINQLAWLLESQQAERAGQIALIPEPISTAPYVETISDNDIIGNISWKRGWGKMVNSFLVFSGYTGSGSGDENFKSAIAAVDQISVDKYERISLEVEKDFWGVEPAELTTRITTYINRWKDGRRVVNCRTTLRLMGVKSGDVILLSSSNLPKGDAQLLKMMVLSSNLNWDAKSISFSLLEI